MKMNPAVLSFISFIISSVGLMLIYSAVFVPRSSLILIFALLIGLFYIFVRRTHETKRKADKLMIISVSFFVSAMLASFIYHNWKLTNVISVSIMTKMTVVILVFISVYLNVIYIRAEQSYKKKRGNQRIKEEPKQGYFEQLFEGFKKDEDDGEITLVIGLSAENEE